MCLACRMGRTLLFVECLKQEIFNVCVAVDAPGLLLCEP